MPVLKPIFSAGDTVAGNYRILGEAGSGGMGIVYRALDLRLERVVALKFLPPDLDSGTADTERFLREARTASSLDHPHIGVIHGVERTSDGQTFIVMAFYEGTSLADYIRRGPLPVLQAVDIAEQMARGLAEAHAHGIIHRDIKPSNVMLTSAGMVKIVDFGLAHAITAQTASISGTAGTVSYMSPEQAMGHTLDQRSDIWSLGIVLAEMLTGVNPFQGETIPTTLFHILNQAPQNITDIDPALQPIIYRALTKEAARRYSSCAEMLADLEDASHRISPTTLPEGSPTTRTPSTRISRPSSLQSGRLRRARQDAARPVWTSGQPRHSRLGTFFTLVGTLLGILILLLLAIWLSAPLRQRVGALITGAAEQKHVAVLPFDNIGSNPENSALTDGLMDSIAGRLSNLDVGNQSLWVVPNSEVRRRRITDPSEALKELGANLVVKGSVERDGSQIHLTVNLIDTRTLRQIGSAVLEDQAGDLSTLEDEAVAELARLMKISVTANMLRDTGGRVNPAAYEDYLTALGYIERYDKPGNLQLAISALNSAVATDPGFALGYAQLGEAYRIQYQVNKNPVWIDEAQANCRKSIELDNHIPEPYVTLGKLHDAAGHYNLAVQEFQQALSLNQRDGSAIEGLAHAYEQAGRISDATATFQKAEALLPGDWDVFDSFGNFLLRQQRYADAVAQFQNALKLTPDNAQVLLNLAGAYIDSGKAAHLPLAESALNQSIKLNPSYGAYANLGLLLFQEHRYHESVQATLQALKLDSSDYLVWDNLRLDYEWLNDASGVQRSLAGERPLLLAQLKLHPRDATAVVTYAELCARFGPRDQALPSLQTALALSPNDPSILEVAASIDQNLGDHTQAVQYMNQAFAKGFPLEDALNDPEAQSLLQDPAVHRPRP